MRLILRPLSDPLLHRLLLLRRELLVSLRWRHEVIDIGRIDAFDQRLWPQLDQFLAHIEAEITLSVILVRSVAVKAVVAEDRSDVAIERQLRCAGQRGD